MIMVGKTRQVVCFRARQKDLVCWMTSGSGVSVLKHVFNTPGDVGRSGPLWQAAACAPAGQKLLSEELLFRLNLMADRWAPAPGC